MARRSSVTSTESVDTSTVEDTVVDTDLVDEVVDENLDSTDGPPSDSEVEEVFSAVPRKPYNRTVEKGYFKNTAEQRLGIIRDTLTSNPSASAADLTAAITAAGLSCPSNCATEFALIKKEMGIGRRKVVTASTSSTERNSTTLPSRVNTALLKFVDVLKSTSKSGTRIFNHDVIVVDCSGELPVIRIK